MHPQRLDSQLLHVYAKTSLLLKLERPRFQISCPDGGLINEVPLSVKIRYQERRRLKLERLACFSPVKPEYEANEISKSLAADLVYAQASEIGNEFFVEEQKSFSDLSCLTGDLDLKDNNFL